MDDQWTGAPRVAGQGTRMYRAQLSDEAASYIRDMIMSGRLPSGTFIRLDHMAEMLEMSVTPVREALVLLRGEGFVQLEPRRGFVVAPLSRADVADMFWVQSEIAGELAARATTHITDREGEELRRMQAELEAASERGVAEEIEQLNFLVHRRINLLARSPKLAWLLRVATRYAPRRFWGTINGWAEASVADHAAILAGLEAREPERVRKAMREHIVHAGTLLVAHLEREGLAEAWADDEQPPGRTRRVFEPPAPRAG